MIFFLQLLQTLGNSDKCKIFLENISRGLLTLQRAGKSALFFKFNTIPLKVFVSRLKISNTIFFENQNQSILITFEILTHSLYFISYQKSGMTAVVNIDSISSFIQILKHLPWLCILSFFPVALFINNHQQPCKSRADD